MEQKLLERTIKFRSSKSGMHFKSGMSSKSSRNNQKIFFNYSPDPPPLYSKPAPHFQASLSPEGGEI